MKDQEIVLNALNEALLIIGDISNPTSKRPRGDNQPVDRGTG